MPDDIKQKFRAVIVRYCECTTEAPKHSTVTGTLLKHANGSYSIAELSLLGVGVNPLDFNF